jgi:hypothetical protein
LYNDPDEFEEAARRPSWYDTVMTAQAIQPTGLWKQKATDADRRLAYGSAVRHLGDCLRAATPGGCVSLNPCRIC